jgi:hypothetical protein
MIGSLKKQSKQAQKSKEYILLADRAIGGPYRNSAGISELTTIGESESPSTVVLPKCPTDPPFLSAAPHSHHEGERERDKEREMMKMERERNLSQRLLAHMHTQHTHKDKTHTHTQANVYVCVRPFACACAHARDFSQDCVPVELDEKSSP